MPCDAWFVIPVEAICGRKTAKMCLHENPESGKLGKYWEAWGLMTTRWPGNGWGLAADVWEDPPLQRTQGWSTRRQFPCLAKPARHVAPGAKRLRLAGKGPTREHLLPVPVVPLPNVREIEGGMNGFLFVRGVGGYPSPKDHRIAELTGMDVIESFRFQLVVSRLKASKSALVVILPDSCTKTAASATSLAVASTSPRTPAALSSRSSFSTSAGLIGSWLLPC